MFYLLDSVQIQCQGVINASIRIQNKHLMDMDLYVKFLYDNDHEFYFTEEDDQNEHQDKVVFMLASILLN